MLILGSLGKGCRRVELMDHEFSALLEALRRDYHSENLRAHSDEEARRMHGCNARMDLRLLEILQPKTTRVNMVRQTIEAAVQVDKVTKTADSIMLQMELVLEKQKRVKAA